MVALTRGQTPECVHFGALAHVNASGQLLSGVGDPHWLCFTRSTLKAMQALPFVHGAGIAQFGLSPEQTALLCASHNGEDAHVAQVTAMLARAGQTRTALRCGCHVPGLFSYLGVAAPSDLQFDERHNNCSGKHAGMVAYCVQRGLNLDDYTARDHPLQAAIRRDVALACGLPSPDMAMGIDGCSAPNYAMPLFNLAWGYARLAKACTGQSSGTPFDAAFAQLGNAMTSHPDMVSGVGRNDLAFMRAGRGDWVTKVGADGVQVVASKSRGEAFAIKIIDANKPALYAATIEALSLLGWLDAAQASELEVWRDRRITNARGLHVGERRCIFSLAPG